MENLKNLFDDFFENRFDNEVMNLRRTNSAYDNCYKSFSNTWDDLSSTLEPYQMDKLHKLIELHNEMNCSDIELAYMNGCKDIMHKLQEISKQNKRANT